MEWENKQDTQAQTNTDTRRPRFALKTLSSHDNAVFATKTTGRRDHRITTIKMAKLTHTSATTAPTSGMMVLLDDDE